MVICVSALLAPELWPQWINLLASNIGSNVTFPTVPVPFLPRLVAAVGVTVWGSVTGRRWTVAVAVTLAMPVLWWNGLVILAAIPRLVRADQKDVVVHDECPVKLTQGLRR